MHAVITGPSGSGKTTIAIALARSRGVSVVSLDNHPLWGQYLRDQNDCLADLRARMNRGSDAYKKCHSICKQIVRDCLLQAGANDVLEGTQFLLCPDELKECELVVLHLPRQLVLWQRMRRKQRNRVRTGLLPYSPDERQNAEMIGEAVYDATRHNLDEIASLAGASVLRDPIQVLAWLRQLEGT